MARYRLLPDAIRHIQLVMGQLGIRPVDPKQTPLRSAAEKARFYMAPVYWRGRKVWFKASLQDAPGLTRGLTEEVAIQRAFADFEKRYRPAFDSPSYLASGRQRKVFWFVRRYWEGIFGGDMIASFGLSSAYLRAVSARRFAQVIIDIRRMTPFMKRRLRLQTHDFGWYQLDWRFYRRHFLAPLLRHPLNPGWTMKTVKDIEWQLDRSRSFLIQHASWFTHGDFYPNNLLLTGHRRKKIVVFDWELSHLNLPTFDAVMVWLLAWRHPAWQKQFYQASMKGLPPGPVTRRAWALAALSLSVRLTGFAFLRLTNGQPSRYPPLPAKYRPAVTLMYHHMVRQTERALQDLQNS